jgi:hypothetical protein
VQRSFLRYPKIPKALVQKFIGSGSTASQAINVINEVLTVQE